MRLRRVSLVLVCLLVCASIAPAAAYAGFYSSRTTSADAWWSSWSWDNGEPGPNDPMTDWNISGYTGGGVFKDAGMPLDKWKGSTGWASMYCYIPATEAEPQAWMEFNCLGEPPSVLMFGRALATAKLQFTAPGTLNIWREAEPWVQVSPDEWMQRDPDESTTEMVDVLATWKATGPLSRTSNINRERTAGYAWADRMSQTYRRASATASIVGASGKVYFMSGSLPVADAQITDGKSNGRFRGEMPY